MPNDDYVLAEICCSFYISCRVKLECYECCVLSVVVSFHLYHTSKRYAAVTAKKHSKNFNRFLAETISVLTTAIFSSFIMLTALSSSKIIGLKSDWKALSMHADKCKHMHSSVLQRSIGN